MAISSIHINPVKANSEFHNKRLKEYDYVRKDLTPNNESWEAESLNEALKRINETYKKNTEQRMQKKATPIREGVVNINPETTMQDLHRLKDALYEKFKIKTIQIHIHRDEGHVKSKEWKQNLHAHMVFDWTDDKGRTLKLNMHDMSKLQDVVAETLNMERGQKSNKKHLSAIAYKVQEAEKDLEELQKKITEYINVTTPENIENYIEKTLFGKKINEDKLQELILSEKAKASIIEDIQKKNEQFKQETNSIIQTYQQKMSELENMEKDLDVEINELNKQKKEYIDKVRKIASQMQELENLRREKTEYEKLKAQYEKLKQYDGLDKSRRYIDESLHIRELYEAKVAQVVFTKLTQDNSYRSKQELYSDFCEEIKKYGFTETWEENLFFEVLEEDMNIQYTQAIRGRRR